MFATTALVATAGVAMADDNLQVAISGFAEMGVIGGSEIDSQFFTDVDVRFDMSGEADNGLTFTANIDLDQVPNGVGAGTRQGGETVGIAFGGFTLTMGDTDGALDWAMAELDAGGAINDDHTSHAGFSGNGGIDLADLVGAFFGAAPEDFDSGIGLDGWYDGQIARATYSMDNLAIAASLEVSDDRDVALAGADWNAKAVFGVGARYTMDSVAFGVGFQNVSVESETAGVDDISASAIGASVSYAMDAVTVGINVSKNSYDLAGTDVDLTHMGIGASYTMNALTLAANYGTYKLDVDLAGVPDFTNSGWGVSAVYNMGGGLSAQFGYGASNFDEDLGLADDSTNSWSLGLAMSF
jgi:outer membrane protein OmpU